MPKISVIVPVYKVEKYLNRCVDSILNQTFTDFELILVDDGSPDNCGKICDEYAAKDTRVVVIHKENGGLSDARNAGIDWSFANSNSEYIAFVDSDDWVHEQYLERLYTSLTTSNADLAICDLIQIDENEKTVACNGNFRLSNESISQIEAFERIPQNWHYVVAWNKLYKKNTFDNLRYPKGRIHEDEFLIHHVFGLCNKIAIISDELYFYVRRSDSIMGSRKNITSKLDYLYAIVDRALYCKQHNIENIVNYNYLEWLFGNLIDCKSFNSEQKSLFKKIKKLYRPIFFSDKKNRKFAKYFWYDFNWLYSFLKGNKNNAEN